MQNVQAEHNVLAGMLNDTEFLYDALAELNEEFFTTTENAELFKELEKRSDREIKSSILLQEFQGKKKSHLRVVDGEWVDVEHSENAMRNVKELYIKRQLNYTIDKIKNQIENRNSDELIAELEETIGSFYFDDANENIIDPEEYANESLKEFYELLADPDKAKGIPFSIQNSNGTYKGFPTLDKAFNGAQGGDLIMVAAKTGHGKTGLAITLSRLFSLYQDYAGYYENTEMKKREMLSRLLSPIAKVTVTELLNAQLVGTQEERREKMDNITKAHELYKRSKFYMSRVPSLPLHKAKGLAKQVRNRYRQLDYLVIDYIGRMTIEGKNNFKTWDEMYEITKQLKELAMSLDIPIFMLAQLNDEGKVEGAKKMKNECDGVLFLQPIEESDKEYLTGKISEEKLKAINYKIIQEKVRRNDNSQPIYLNYAKDMQFINEVTL